MLICVLALFNSGGMLHSCSWPLFRSSLAMAPWYIMPAHRFCSRSKRSDSRPVGEPVVRLDRRPRQVVLGDDGARSPAARAKEALQRKPPARPHAEIDGAQP